MPSIDLKAYARRGAEARIAELTAELNDIYKAFPTCDVVGQVRHKLLAVVVAGSAGNDGGSEGGSVEADEGVLGGEEGEEGTIAARSRPRKKHLMSKPALTCGKCDAGWICERHADQPWPHNQYPGPAMACDVADCPYRVEPRPDVPPVLSSVSV